MADVSHEGGDRGGLRCAADLLHRCRRRKRRKALELASENILKQTIALRLPMFGLSLPLSKTLTKNAFSPQLPVLNLCLSRCAAPKADRFSDGCEFPSPPCCRSQAPFPSARRASRVQKKNTSCLRAIFGSCSSHQCQSQPAVTDTGQHNAHATFNSRRFGQRRVKSARELRRLQTDGDGCFHGEVHFRFGDNGALSNFSNLPAQV